MAKTLLPSSSAARLRPDDGEVDGLALREAQKAVHVVRREVEALGVPRDPGVAGRAVDAVDLGRLGDLPDERVLAAAASDDEDLHAGFSCGGFDRGRLRS